MLSKQTPRQVRDRTDIVVDIERLSQENGFIYTFCHLVFDHLLEWADEVAEIRDLSQKLNSQELSFLLGLMVKHPLKLGSFPSAKSVQDRSQKVIELFGELQETFGLLLSEAIQEKVTNVKGHSGITKPNSNWMESGDRIVEPIFYGGNGAYDFQYLELVEQLYAKDRDWLHSYLGSSLESFTKITKILRQLIQYRFMQLGSLETVEDIYKGCFAAFTFSPNDITGLQRESVSSFLETFSCTPGTVNKEFNTIGAYNAVLSHPVIRLADNQYFLPIQLNLAQALYESPFYWMLKDPLYINTANQNRGEAIEDIASRMLSRAFGDQHVYRGVEIPKSKETRADIDVLAIAGNKAVIVQAKSKKLTELSRTGDTESLKKDFKQAVQDAYGQGLECRTALLEKRFSLKDRTGKSIKLCEEIDDAYIVCVTGYHYPAVTAQLNAYLQKAASDPYPLAMSVFDLDIVSFYLTDPFELLYYLRQRSNHAEHFIADSEVSFLGFHLSNKLYPEEKVEALGISPSFAQMIDTNFPMVKGHYPQTDEEHKLFHEWNNVEFDQLVEFVQAAGHPGFADALFYLFDLAGAGADNIIKGILNRKGATIAGGYPQTVSFPSGGDRRGISFVSYPQTYKSVEDHFISSARAWKYKYKADEWLALGSIAGSLKLVDMASYSNEKWEYDPELEALVNSVLQVRRTRNLDGQKIGRNQECPCGSGQKFKKCHGR